MTKYQSIFSILLLSASLTLLWAELMPAPQHAIKSEQESTLPDSYMTDVMMRHFDQQGHLRQQLQAKRATHTPYQNTIYYDLPRITLISKTGSNWTLSAKNGDSKQGKEVIELRKHVKLFRPGSLHNPETLATTSMLKANTDQKILTTDKAIRIEQPKLLITGIGLHGDLNSGDLKTVSQTKTTFRKG